MKDLNRKVECVSCYLVHRITDRTEMTIEGVTSNHCPKCSDESYYDDDLVIDFKNSENTEGVSDARTKSGVLHDVGESHASGETCKSDLASGELPLEKITDSENTCQICGGERWYETNGGLTMSPCPNKDCVLASEKES